MSSTRVLLVEDNRADARLVKELLSEIPERPFSLTTVGTLGEALPQLATHDVVLLDLSLPDAHGLSTVERMVSAGRRRPIVVLTGNDDQKIAMEALKAGAQDYLLKAEMTPSLVARSIRYALERKRVELAEVARVKSDQAAERAKFLAMVMSELTRSLDVGVAMTGLARLVVPTLADLCAVDFVAENGRPARVALAATSDELSAPLTDPELDAARAGATLRAIECGATYRACVGQDGGELKALLDRSFAPAAPLRSLLVTPLVVRERVLGAVTYAFASSGRRHDEDERLLCEEIAAHAALAMDNAMLFQKAQQAIQARDGLLAVVSHDLRNPLDVISLALSLLERTSTSEQLSPVRRAQHALTRMTRLISDLLDVARIDAGGLVVELEPVAISELLDEAYELHRPLALEKQITLLREYPRELGRAVADRHRILQVLSNLLGNSLKFTPQGGSIRLGAELNAAFVSIWVQDSGAGISAENLTRVFDKFWQKERNAKGVGLGLAIVKGIVEAHGGSVCVDSAPGQGTIFSFRLRRAEHAAETTPVEAAI